MGMGGNSAVHEWHAWRLFFAGLPGDGGTPGKRVRCQILAMRAAGGQGDCGFVVWAAGLLSHQD